MTLWNRKVKTPWWGFSRLFIIMSFIIFSSLLKAIEIPSEPLTPDSLRINDIVVIKDKGGVLVDTDGTSFPYFPIKISQIENGRLSFNIGKNAYSTSYEAEKDVRSNREISFYDDIYEISIEEFKRNNIIYINRQK